MYPPRSQRSSEKKKVRRTRNTKIRIVNVILIVAIGLIGLYYLLNTREQQPSQPANSEVVQQRPPSGADDKGGDALKQSEPDDDPAETPGKDVAPVDGKPDAEPDATVDNSESGTNEISGAGGEKPSTGTKSATTTGKGTSGKTDGNKGTPTSDSSKDVTIHFVGDIQFSGKVAELLEKNGYDYPFAKLGSMFQNDDLTIGNLETPVTHGGTGAADKTYVYKSSPKALQAMSAAGFDAVNLANNHILDQGVEGLVDTLTYLNDYGIAHAGAGMNGTEAYEPAYFERKGMKIALLGFSRVVPVASWKADGNRAGVAEAYDSTRAIAAIQSARKKADLVIVVAHWGEERVSTPNADQTRLAHEFVDAGADLIIGGHPHVLQGLEYYKGKWIAYSTGNFIFTKSTNEETWKTAVFQARCSREAVCSMKVIPYEAALGQAVPMLDEANRLLLEQMAKMSSGIRVNADGTVVPN